VRPSTNPVSKADAGGSDARRVLIAVGIVSAAAVLGAELYFALARPEYDVRTGGLRVILAVLVGTLVFGLMPDTRTRLNQGRTRLRKISLGALFSTGNMLLLLPLHPSWLTFGAGTASLAAAVLLGRIGLPRAAVSGTTVGPT